MQRKIVKTCLFFLAVLLMSAPAWSSTSKDFSPAVSTASLTAETGAGFILAKNGDCEPDPSPDGDANGYGAENGGTDKGMGPGGEQSGEPGGTDNGHDRGNHGEEQGGGDLGAGPDAGSPW